MRIRDAVALGAVQGLTEFLPVSSSAHLLLVRRVLGHADVPRAFDVAMHGGTLAALLVESGPDIARVGWALAGDVARHGVAVGCYRPEGRLGLRAALATVPAVVAGGLLHDGLLRRTRPDAVAMMLWTGAALMAVAELRRGGGHAEGLDPWRALGIGAAQAAALAPGLSRSGVTVAAGVLMGLNRRSAVRFSTLLAAPVMVAAGVRSLRDLREIARQVGPGPMAAGTAAAVVTGVVSIAALRRATGRGGLLPFVVYRSVLALAIRRWAGR